MMESSKDEKLEWVELLDPKSQRTMYVNLKSGECCWEPPQNQKVKPMSDDQWWELFDVKVQRNYYYNSNTRETVWQKPASGDIIPLANLQLLQQNMQSAPNSQTSADIGMLRRASAKGNGNSINRKVQHRKLATSILECHSQPNHCPTNAENVNMSCTTGPAVDNVRLSAHLFTADSRSVQQIPVTTAPLKLYGGNQRIREWLRDSGGKCEKPLVENVTDEQTKSHDLAAIRMSGCYSDKPVRRNQSMPKCSAGNNNGDIECVQQTATAETLSNTDLVQQQQLHGGSNNNSTCSSILSARDVRMLRTGTVHGGPQSNSPRRISAASPLVSPCKTTTMSDTSRSVSNVSYIPFTSASNGIPVKEVITDTNYRADGCNLVSGSLVCTPNDSSFHTAGKSAQPCGAGLNYPIIPPMTAPVFTRQRAFPRTNPTVSRFPAVGCISKMVPRFTAATLDPSGNRNLLIVSSAMISQYPPPPPTYLVRPVQRNLVNNGTYFSSTDLRSPTFGTCPVPSQASYPEYLGASGCTAVPSNPASPSRSINQPQLFCPVQPLFSQSASIPSSEGLRALPSLEKRHSSSSDSPQPSSSVSSSFSRASSETALTNANSDEEGREITRAASMKLAISTDMNNSRRGNGEFVAEYLPDPSKSPSPYAKLLVQELDPPHNHTALEDESGQPPIPPPRSASTMGPRGLSNENAVAIPGDAAGQMMPGMLNDMHYPLVNSQLYCLISAHTEISTDGYHNVISSLSRKDPVRAHVIQPNHRRPPPFAQQLRLQPGLVPIHQDENSPHENHLDYAITSAVDACSTTHLVSPTNSPTTPLITTDFLGTGSMGHMRMRNASPSTGTTWVSHSTTATWDGNLNKIKPNEKSETRQSGGENDSSTAVLSGMPKRSASGGFIGPEDMADGVWSGGGQEYGRQSSMPAMRLPQMPTLVYPGHPAYSDFTSLIDWPKGLFKSESDIATSMSWTKSNFSKRLLVSTDPSVKKQVGDTFKMIQSFMGDRKARLSLPDYGSIIIQRALSSASLRDEIFAQLCKQTTSNPNARSLTNGWALLCVCLYYFPPGSKFRDALSTYLSSRAISAVSTLSPDSASQPYVKIESSLEAAAAIASGFAPIVSELCPSANEDSVNKGSIRDFINATSVKNEALHLPSSLDERSAGCFSTCRESEQYFGLSLCPWDRPTAAHFARVAPRWFVRALNVGCRKNAEPPSIEEICHVKDFILKPNIFGGSLEEMMHIQAYRFPSLQLPWIQIFLTEELLRLSGSRTEGIFRLSPDLDVVTDVRCQLEKLFEIFRVVQMESNHADECRSSDRYLVLRPPPSGWFYSPREFETERLSAAASDYVEPVTSPSFPEFMNLTGGFTWPLTPLPLNSPPAEYILLTPTAHWPQTLWHMLKRSATGTYDEDQADPHLAAGLLKLWLRELAEPLIPNSLQPMCLKAACEAEAYESKRQSTAECVTDASPNPIEKCCQLVRQIPFLKRRSLLYLILLLQHLAKPEHCAISLMDARNLATVIAPNLMRSDSTNPRELLENIRPQTVFVRILISHLNVKEETEQLLFAEQNAVTQGYSLASNCQAFCCPPARVKLGPNNSFIPT
ncbi:unnamed protein product [Calicophoron daubneyi]|uniref:Rho GTPase-activating protein 39 n=1 Tax=Calicophoron daubneyi TaxID=300641 RepID=A0AAV2T9M7_CALDB